MVLKSVLQTEIKEKKVLVRGDIDVPLGNGVIANDQRLTAILPTIKFLLENGNKVVLCGHMGRPGGKIEEGLSTRVIAQWFSQKILGGDFAPTTWLQGRFRGFIVGENLLVLENLRFDSGEESCDENFARELAGLGEVFVNESFAECHRDTSSISRVPKLLPSFAGLRLAKEVEILSGVLENPVRPVLAIIGGAKVETKVPVISGLTNIANRILVGGKIVMDLFSYSRDHNVSLNRDKVVALPLTADFKDIFPQAIENSVSDFLLANTIIWNGPFGMVEEETWQPGSKKVMDLILRNKKAFKIVGGGDTIGFLDKMGTTSQFNWVSVGGGAMLSLLAGETLPGIKALIDQ